MLLNPTGVLAGCRRLADAATVFENCVLDFCAFAGDTAIHDRVISDFTEDCRSEGGQLPDTWRQEANLSEFGVMSILSVLARRSIVKVNRDLSTYLYAPDLIFYRLLLSIAILAEVSCPDHSHFATCMDECQRTCWDLDGSECEASGERSQATCVEGKLHR